MEKELNNGIYNITELFTEVINTEDEDIMAVKSVYPDVVLDDILVDEHKLEFECTLCGNTGYMANGQKCTNPNCKALEEQLEKAKMKKPRPYYVPKKYENEDWDINTAIDTFIPIRADKSDKTEFTNFCKVLDSIKRRAINNTMILDSILVCAPAKSSKKRWAYTLMGILNNNNITTRIKYLNELETENATMGNVLLIIVTRYQFKENLDKLDDVITKRRNLDLSTIIISEVASKYFISSIDNRRIHVDIVADFLY